MMMLPSYGESLPRCMVSSSLPDLCELRSVSRAQIEASHPWGDVRGMVNP
jgi:hypothetical protein